VFILHTATVRYTAVRRPMKSTCPIYAEHTHTVQAGGFVVSRSIDTAHTRGPGEAHESFASTAKGERPPGCPQPPTIITPEQNAPSQSAPHPP
jgi:hypothetical protein